MQVQRTLPGPEDIVSLATDHLPYQLPAIASLTHDLLDRYAALRQSEDDSNGLLAAQVALVLETLGGCEQLGINRGRTDDSADLVHRFADGIAEGPTGILHQMPTIRDLYRVRQGLCRGLAISATTVTGDDRDRGMSSKPRLGSRGFTIRQQRDDPAPFQIADDAGVSVIAPPSPVVDADDPQRVSRRTAPTPDHPQQRILTHWQHQPFCEARRRSPAKR